MSSYLHEAVVTLPSLSTTVTVVVVEVLGVVPSGGVKLTIKVLFGSMAISSSSIGISMHAMVMSGLMVTVVVVTLKSSPSVGRGRDGGHESVMRMVMVMVVNNKN